MRLTDSSGDTAVKAASRYEHRQYYRGAFVERDAFLSGVDWAVKVARKEIRKNRSSMTLADKDFNAALELALKILGKI